LTVTPGQNYDGIAEPLRAAGAKKLQFSMWAYRADNTTPRAIGEALRQYLDVNDRLFVAEAINGIGWNWVSDLRQI
jgi:hypothetical protein